MKYLAYLFVIIVVAGSLYYANNNQYLGANEETSKIEGIILKGSEINKEHCSDAVYVVPDTLVYPTLQLRNSDGEIIKSSEFVGSTVVVSGYYDKELLHCEALMCECDEFVTVNEITKR